MKENVNYYFAIKQQIGDMESFEESLHQIRKERIKNKPINEADEYNDEETKQSPIM
jgi:regulator of PEP synthase PpsR (kinase-PPPase family)